MKNGNYKGDLAQGGAISLKEAAIPASRLISSQELKLKDIGVVIAVEKDGLREKKGNLNVATKFYKKSRTSLNTLKDVV
ncbi:hypothetical protein E2562_016300 [Oryza meyeriana var. granulata]|uniref:Uncharacterized protein n=1 Tax=Oryza meyeriana var. granulata TaxID=110450 RepID=A0A6G1DVX0_9ORYZ|nr:hypothetical protein E2562_016300 [Oryza meyeriana var. granulata]